MTTKAWKDLAIGATALLAFPLAVNLTAVAADGDGRSVDDPLWQRGGETPSRLAGR